MQKRNPQRRLAAVQNPTVDPAPAADAAAEPVPTTFSTAIYDAITKTFANKNPTQMFCLCWPGTVLDADHLGWEDSEETAGLMPERALIRSSQILDQYIPPAPITQPDGTRLSDRYTQAIAQLGPRPSVDLIRLQEVIRERLQKPVSVVINGKETTMRLVEYFDYLFQQWVRAKQAWGALQAEMRARFRADNPLNPTKAWDDYLAWYAVNADGYIADVNSKYDTLLVEFPLVAWEDALTVLDTSDDGGLNEAKQLVRNGSIPVPYQEGASYYPTRGVPYSWPKELQPSTKFVDLLADPAAQKQSLDTARTQLELEIGNWMAILPQFDDSAIKEAAVAFQEAGGKYNKAQTALLTRYTDNAVSAAKMVIDIMASRGLPTTTGEQDATVAEFNGLNKDLDLAQKKPAPAALDWTKFKALADEVGLGQKGLIEDQQHLIDTGFQLAGAASKFLASGANRIDFPWLAGYIKQLESKLAAVDRMERDLASASNVYYSYLKAPGNSGADPGLSNEFGTNAFPSRYDYPENARWTEIVITVDKTQLNTNKTLSTYFDQMQWGVNLFLASAGGTTEVSGSDFANKFMKQDSKIQIGFLCTKVLIDRPWMKPEIFGNTDSYFRTLKKPLAPNFQMTHEQLLGDKGQDALKALLDDHSFPAYPVAVLLAKDVTIKVAVDVAESEALRKTAKSVKSQGGGFFCFSISRSEAASSEEDSMNSYVMAGQMITRAPAPQIIGYWTQFLPPDRSTVIDETVARDIAAAIGFVGNMQAAHSAARESKVTPTRNA